MKTILLILSLFLTLSPFVNAELGEETVTYGNFSIIHDIAVSLNKVYFATSSGITVYDILDKSWEDPLNSSPDIDHTDIQRVWVDQFDKYIYVKTSMSKYEYDITLKSWYEIDEIPSLDLSYNYVDSPDIMYAPPGFNYMADGYLIDPVGRDFAMNVVVKDDNGNLWLSCYGYGAAHSTTIGSSIDLLPFGLLQDRVDDIYNLDGKLFIGGRILNSFRTGLTIFNPDNNKFEYLESVMTQNFPEVNINCIEFDSSFLYIGTDQGVYLFDRKNDFQFSYKISTTSGLPNDIIYSMKAVNNKLFVGTPYGLAVLAPKKAELTLVNPKEFINTEIYDLAVSDSTLWMGTSNGAYRMNYYTGKLQKFNDPNQVIFSRVQKVVNFDDVIWFAADDGLVSLNLKNGKVTPYRGINHGKTIYDFTVNEFMLAMISSRGVRFIEDYENEKYTIYEIDENDGIPTNQINKLLFDGDFIWIGSNRGLTRFLWNSTVNLR